LVDDFKSAEEIRRYFVETKGSRAPRIVTKQGDRLESKAIMNPKNKCPSEDQLDFIFGENPLRRSSALEANELGWISYVSIYSSLRLSVF
jgi:hypothetical protein